MNTSFWTPYISDGTIQAICWTLIHSLWIGLVIALLCGVIIAVTRKSAAALRYRLLCGLLVLFVCAIGVTYYLEINSVSASAETGKGKIEGMVLRGHNSVVINQVVMPQNQTILSSLQVFLNQNVNIIFMVWLLFFVLKSLKMASGLLYIQRIKNYKTHPVTEDLKHKIEMFSSQIGIGRAVRLVRSELVKVPVAVGWLKPMILLPVGIALQLTPEQLDGILWHELAHIRRQDYLVNIMQGLVETVFFFNPALLWLSSLIRAEREACCDDMVLSRLNRKANYLEALLSFGYGEFNQARYAMSIGSGNQLRDRVKRMISQENKRLSVAEKSVLAVGLVLLSAFTTISKDNPIVKNLSVKFTNKAGKVGSKTFLVSMHRLPEGQRLNDSKPGNREKHSIYLTDTAIRFTSILFKKSDADLANNDINAIDSAGNKYHFVVTNNKLVSMEMNGTKVKDGDLPGYEYMIRQIDAVVTEKRLIRAQFNAYDRTGLIRKFNGGPIPKFKAEKPFDKMYYSDSMRFKPYNGNQKAYGVNPAGMKYENMVKRFHDDSVRSSAELQNMLNIVADLVAEKLVAKASDVKWFGLSNTEFIVNGEKQPNETQQRYKAKYGVHEGYGLYYGPVQMTGRGVFIDLTAPNGGTPRKSALPKQPMFGYEQPKFKEGQQKMQMRSGQWFKPGYAQPPIALQDIVANIAGDLVTENIVKDKSGLRWFRLTNSALIVNGKTQPEELHQKLKGKYLSDGQYPFNNTDNPNFGLHYNTQTGSMGMGITVGGPDE